ncbi:HpcH/HpaI aldolase/citrate lyase family protein [Xylophilus rhododendri]|uniref:HpcH/HpaI aldolase/citrate lyase family protein n=1 Tax=Xylophilus rhododendri TaxID=2697032 RepID=A0A857J1V0_9BURK|nr:CoA ester lyase [Xylophilus rhododendri]QHI97213.1 HpcH/HpaI aldolase/citrate lyase family protein [Xylophilus rhododendri]
MNPARAFEARTLLFVPGDRPERFAKAVASGTDCICIDLEDAVASDRKAAARAEVMQYLQQRQGGPFVCIRANGLRTAEGLRDLLALLEVPPPDAVLLPKTESAQELQLASEVAGDGRLRWIALIESAQGLRNADDIVLHSPHLAALMFGGVDFSVDIGAAFQWESLLYARQKLVCAAALKGLPLIDVPFLDLDRPEALAEETRRVAALGFACKSAIHPRQVADIHLALRPTDAQLDKARRIVEAAEAAGGGVFTVDGKMVDAPVIAGARRTLALAPR